MNTIRRLKRWLDPTGATLETLRAHDQNTAAWFQSVVGADTP